MFETILAWAGWHGGPWFLFFPLFWIALLVGAWFLFRRRDDRGRGDSAEEILGERYARGEITAEEYRERREVLRSAGWGCRRSGRTSNIRGDPVG